MGVKHSLILIGGNMSDYTPVLTVIPLPGKFANIFTKKLGRKRVEDTEQALMHVLRQKRMRQNLNLYKWDFEEY